MHASAWIKGYFFWLYYNEVFLIREFIDERIRVLDVGSADINGNIFDALVEAMKLSTWEKTHEYDYSGLDMVESFNVNIVGTVALVNKSFHVIVSTSALEHDDFFWDTFLHITDALEPGGCFYTTIPTIQGIHRFPVDNWRFLPDSAIALRKWAHRNGRYVDCIFSDLSNGEVGATKNQFNPCRYFFLDSLVLKFI